MQGLEVRKARSELREQFVRRRSVDDEDREASNGCRRPREHLERAVSVLREEGEGDALHGARSDHLQRHHV